MTNSCRKGKEGERLAVKLFRSFGFTARRGQQHRGGPDSPDIVVDELPEWHFEIKFGDNCGKPRDWMDQALEERGENQSPCVMWKPDRKPWRALIPTLLHDNSPMFLIARQYGPIDLVVWSAVKRTADRGVVRFYSGLVEFDARDLLCLLAGKLGGILP